MTNLRICTVGLDHNWWFLTTFLMFFLWFSWFIAPETDSKKITKIIGILPNALELGCQKLSKKCTGINLRGKAGSRTNPEVFKIHRCLCFRVCMGQCCQRLVIKFLSRGVSLLLAAYHSQKLAQKAVGRASCHLSFHGDFPWFDRRRAGCDSETHLVLNNSSGVCYNGWQHEKSSNRQRPTPHEFQVCSIRSRSEGNFAFPCIMTFTFSISIPRKCENWRKKRVFSCFLWKITMKIQ